MTKHLSDMHVVSTASAVGGSILSGSDVDQMFVVENMTVFEEVDIDDRSKYHFLCLVHLVPVVQGYI
jgi:hypothetical protein